MKKIINKNGFSLLELTMVVGVCIGLALIALELTKNLHETNKLLERNTDLIQLEQEVTARFAYRPDICKKNLESSFKGIGYITNGVGRINYKKTVDKNDAIIIENDKWKYNNKIYIFDLLYSFSNISPMSEPVDGFTHVGDYNLSFTMGVCPQSGSNCGKSVMNTYDISIKNVFSFKDAAGKFGDITCERLRSSTLIKSKTETLSKLTDLYNSTQPAIKNEKDLLTSKIAQLKTDRTNFKTTACQTQMNILIEKKIDGTTTCGETYTAPKIPQKIEKLIAVQFDWFQVYNWGDWWHSGTSHYVYFPNRSYLTINMRPKVGSTVTIYMIGAGGAGGNATGTGKYGGPGSAAAATSNYSFVVKADEQDLACYLMPGEGLYGVNGQESTIFCSAHWETIFQKTAAGGAKGADDAGVAPIYNNPSDESQGAKNDPINVGANSPNLSAFGFGIEKGSRGAYGSSGSSHNSDGEVFNSVGALYPCHQPGTIEYSNAYGSGGGGGAYCSRGYNDNERDHLNAYRPVGHGTRGGHGAIRIEWTMLVEDKECLPPDGQATFDSPEQEYFHCYAN